MNDAAITVLYENEDFLAIDKPIGITVQREDGEDGVHAMVQAQCQLQELYVVHRLDKITSGVVLFAKTTQANQRLCEMFREHTIEKTYIAISEKKPKKKQGMIKGDMERTRRGAWCLSRSTENPAITRFTSHSVGEGVRLYVLRPQTGKTHQLRVAMKSISAPITGDALYAGDAAKYADRAYLHAARLNFEWNGERLTIDSLSPEGRYFDWPTVREVIRQQFEVFEEPKKGEL
jgi:tRNA pseudouridine32 synthase/23S rRNA pseudouridine746 synthase